MSIDSPLPGAPGGVRTAPAAIRVVSVPADHPYVNQLAHGQTGFAVLADEPPPGTRPGAWWPTRQLQPEWILSHARDFDVFHLHFGTESLEIDQLRGVVDALRRTGRPLVYTVHDLQNPQLTDQRRHLEQLDLLIPAADAVITLTRGAAAEIAAGWGRTATVIEHPRVLPPGQGLPAVPKAAGPTIGLYLKDLRPNVDAEVAVGTLGRAVDLLAGTGTEVRARVHLNDRVRTPEKVDRITALCAASDRVELRVRPRMTDQELIRSLLELDACVLPYRHGTHSGWLELCWDLGIPVLAPTVGHYRDQHPDPAFFQPFEAGSAAQLAVAITAAGRRASDPQSRFRLQQMRRVERERQQRHIAQEQLAVYRAVLSGRAGHADT